MKKNYQPEDRQHVQEKQASNTDRIPPDGPRYSILETFIRNRKSLHSFISRCSARPHEVEDISQEAFLRAFEVEKKRRIEEPKAFLFRIARNLILSESGKKSRKITDYIEDFEPSDVLMEGESLEANVMTQQRLGIFCEAVAAPPAKCREVVLLKKVCGLSHKEIADQLGIAVGTWRNTSSRVYATATM